MKHCFYKFNGHMLWAIVLISYAVCVRTRLGYGDLFLWILVLWAMGEIFLSILETRFVYRTKKQKVIVRFMRCCFVTFYCILLLLATSYFLNLWKCLQLKTEEIKSRDRVLILGCQLQDNKMTEFLLGRLEQGVNLISKSSEKVCIIVTGGSGRYSSNEITEASLMSKYLEENQIEQNRIIVEEESISTYQNINYCKKYFESFHLIVITNEFHAPRVKMILDELGIEDYRFSCSDTPGILLPYYMFEEMLGCVAYKIGIK